jgi:crotonobetainyl-CoA:carnitine CoA-transferase CaiB-like acyl-CoA transferase
MAAVGLPVETAAGSTGSELEAILLSRSTEEWLARFRLFRIPSATAWAAPTLVESLRSEPQIRAEALLEEHDPRRGGVLYAARPWEIVDVKPGPVRPAPDLGEHDELLKSVMAPMLADPRVASSAPLPEYPMKPLARSHPLAGNAIVELGTGLAVGTAGMILAELGASVTKVLPPWGDSAVTSGPAALVVEQLHEQKSMVQLDLRLPGDRTRLDDTLRQAGAVVVCGPMRFRQAFGLDEASIRAVQPNIVYCGLTGFGRSGPLADVPATEFDVQLMSGMTRQLGQTGEAPVRQGFHLASVNTGYAAAQAVMAGLLAAGELPCGRHFEVSMLRTAVALNGWNITAESGHDGVQGKQVQAWVWPPDHGFTCKDRQVLISIKNSDEGWVKFLVAMDRTDLLADERFNTLEQLRANEWQLPRLLAERTSQMTSEELRSMVEKVGGQLVPVIDPAEVLGHPQVTEQRLVDPGGRRIGLPIDMVCR